MQPLIRHAREGEHTGEVANACVYLVLSVANRSMFGDVANDHVAALQDLNQREFLVLGLLGILVLLIGIWPAPLLDLMHASVDNLLQHVVVSKL